jgi:hypothetical protein
MRSSVTSFIAISVTVTGVCIAAPAKTAAARGPIRSLSARASFSCCGVATTSTRSSARRSITRQFRQSSRSEDHARRVGMVNETPHGVFSAGADRARPKAIGARRLEERKLWPGLLARQGPDSPPFPPAARGRASPQQSGRVFAPAASKTRTSNPVVSKYEDVKEI